MGDEGGEDQGPDGSTVSQGQDKQQKQSTGTHMIELGGE